MRSDLNRFLEAQSENYGRALAEIRSGKKNTHWMWFIFPQLKELGNSQMSLYYGIRDLNEATQYLRHPVLGRNLVRISKVLADLNGTTAQEIFGSPDVLKLRSSLTLFSSVKETNAIFEQLIFKYFENSPDEATRQLLGK